MTAPDIAKALNDFAIHKFVRHFDYTDKISNNHIFGREA